MSKVICVLGINGLAWQELILFTCPDCKLKQASEAEMGDFPQASATVKIDNERVRVTEWSFEPGQATGHHRHELDYIVVPLTTGRLKIIDNSGAESDAQLERGEPYFRYAGVEHNVINDDSKLNAFIELELK